MQKRHGRFSARGRIAALLALAATLVALSGASRPERGATRVWRVTPDGDGDVATIQAALDAAAPGDVVVLADGVYTGEGNADVVFLGFGDSEQTDSVVVRSESGDAERCIVDGEGATRGFYLQHTDPTSFVLDGVTVSNVVSAVVTNPGFRESHVVLRDCIFRDTSRDGFVTAGETEAVIARCAFRNVAWSGITSRYSSDLTVTGCEFECTGTGATVSESSAGFTDCRFTGNSGGLRVLDRGSTILVRCRFAGNTYSRGGAVQSVDGRINAVDCLFQDNDASIEGGALYSDSEYPISLNGCVFVGNTSPRGAAAFFINVQGAAQISGSTLVGNRAPRGAALFLAQSYGVVLDHVAVAFNDGAPAVDSDDLSTVDATCSDVYGNPGGDWAGPLDGLDVAGGNFSADPLFCAPATGDFHVTTTSPCLTAGCGIVGAFGAGCEMMTAALDAVPGVCPNSFSLDQRRRIDPSRSTDLVSVTLLGALYFDVGDVDLGSVTLNGIAPVATEVGDPSTAPLGGAACDCAAPGADGFADLTLRFLKSSLAHTLAGAQAGDDVTLTVSGRLGDGTPFLAHDCVTIVGRVALYDGVPNPFNPTTQIRYFLPRRAFVRLTVYDVLGRRVDRLVESEQAAGDHIVEWNAQNQSSGVYFCQLVTDGFHGARKMVLVK